MQREHDEVVVSDPAGEHPEEVAGAWPAAIRTAHALTADAAGAEELAVAALVRRGPSAVGDGRRLVLREASSPRRWLRSDRRPATAGDPFLQAWLRLPLRDRALLALRVGDGLDGPAAAAALGRRPERAAVAVAQALDALGAALAPVATTGTGTGRRQAWRGEEAAELDLGELTLATQDGPAPDGWRDPTPQDADDALSPDDPVVGTLAAVLRELADTAPELPDPRARVAAAAATRRRRRVRSTAVAAVLALVLVPSGVVVARRHAAAVDEQRRVERQRVLDAVLHPVVTSTDADTWPTRGNLAQRADLLAQVRAQVVDADGGTTVRSVPFLGEVGGRGVALVVSGPPGVIGGETLYALEGDLAQPVSVWQTLGQPFDQSVFSDNGVPLLSVALPTPGGRAVAVVVTLSSGVSVAFSPRPEIDAQGALSRRYTTVPLTDGTAGWVWKAPADAALLRVRRGAAAPVFGPPEVLWPGPRTRVELPHREAASCEGRAYEELRPNLDEAAVRAAATAGRGPDEIAEVRSVGCARAGGHLVMFVAARLTDGTALQTQIEAFVEGDEITFTGATTSSVPRGRAATYPRATTFEEVGGDPGLSRTVMFCAPGGATAELTAASGTVLARARLAPDGTGVAQADRPASTLLAAEPVVVVRDARGHVRERVPFKPPNVVEESALEGPVQAAATP
jgi:hypothetical protein